MIYKLRFLLLILFVTNCVHAEEDSIIDDACEIIYKNEFLEGCQRTWRAFYPHRVAPEFFCPPNGGWPKNPGPKEIEKVAQACQYIGWRASGNMAILLLHYVANQMFKDSVQKTVLIKYQDMPLVTFHTCFNAIATFGLSTFDNNNRGHGLVESASYAVVDGGIEAVTDITHNVIGYNLNKIARALQMEDSIDSKTKRALSWFSKQLIRYVYCSLYCSITNAIQKSNFNMGY